MAARLPLAIIGGGPAGLRAAEVAAANGVRATLFEGKASVGRKFLIAGKGGLNLTNAEPAEQFVRRYSAGPWDSLLAECDPPALRAWAADLGVETFAATTGRVYPVEMKAAPLLRRWLQRLRRAGIEFAVHHRWTGLDAGDGWRLEFASPQGLDVVTADAVILALGGASWPETGSDGTWLPLLQKHGIEIGPLVPANCGWEVAWRSDVLTEAEGQPLKNLRVHAGESAHEGELVVTHYGLEGGPIYLLGPSLRAMNSPQLVIDFKPRQSAAELAGKLAPAQRITLIEAARRWNLSRGAVAVIRAVENIPPLADVRALAAAVKHCAIPLVRPRPIAEAISSAGGIRWSELTDTLMLRKLPGVFVAGEMIDWEAPTGGYLIQGCFATGTRAGHAAAAWVQSSGGDCTN